MLCLSGPALVPAFEGEQERVRGRLTHAPGSEPMLRTADGIGLRLLADPESLAVLNDERVRAEVFEAVGRFEGTGGFRVDPIYKKAMFVIRGGEALVITYWCEVCAIRTYSPGKCQCCQEETDFDPRDPALEARAR